VPGQKPTGVVGNLGGWQYDESNGAVWPNRPEYSQQIQSAEAVVPLGP